jgi:hypothetical protein
MATSHGAAMLAFVLLAVFMMNTSSFRSPASVLRTSRFSCSSSSTNVNLADKFKNRSLLLEQVIEKLKSKNAALEVKSAQDMQSHQVFMRSEQFAAVDSWPDSRQ